MFSFHGELATVAAEDLVCDNDFLGASPPVLVAPNIAPVQEVGHGEHRNRESSDEGLAADHWEEHIGCGRGDNAILEASELILLHPVVILTQVPFGGLRDVAIINEPMDELTLLVPTWFHLGSAFLVESLVGLHEKIRSSVDSHNTLDLL